MINRHTRPSQGIYIQFNDSGALVQQGRNIDFRYFVFDSAGNRETIFQEWNVRVPSQPLDELLEQTGWNFTVLDSLQAALQRANCMSVRSGKVTQIGFKFSGLGRYSYALLDSAPAANDIEQYNDKCTYIYYQDDVVLMYEGGAAGAQCFPDPE